MSRIAGLNEALENMKKNIDVFTYRVQDGTARTVAKYTTSAAAAGTQTYYEDDIEEIGTAIRKEHPTLSSAKITSGYISHKKKVVTQLVKKQHTAFDSKWSVLFFLRSVCKTEFSPSHTTSVICLYVLPPTGLKAAVSGGILERHPELVSVINAAAFIKQCEDSDTTGEITH